MLILFGFQGSGKTYYGSRLAHSLNWEFVDTDEQIVKRVGLSCREYVALRGEEAFRELENEVIASLDMKDEMIVALGGGSLVNRTNYALLSNKGKWVYLRVPQCLLKERWNRRGSFEELYFKRLPVYEQIPAWQVDCEAKTEQEVLWELIHLATFSKSRPGGNPTEKPLGLSLMDVQPGSL